MKSSSLFVDNKYLYVYIFKNKKLNTAGSSNLAQDRTITVRYHTVWPLKGEEKVQYGKMAEINSNCLLKIIRRETKKYQIEKISIFF